MPSRLLISVGLLGFALACGAKTIESGPAPAATSAGAGGAGALGSAGISAGGSVASDRFAAGGFPAAVGGGVAASVVLPSSGCGKPLPAEQALTIPNSRTGYTEFHVTQTGATLGADVPTDAGERQFFVRVPADYDQARPYRVVYIGSGCSSPLGGGKANTYPLFDERAGGSEQAVYVGLSVPDNDANPGCYDNNRGAESQEWEAFDLIHTFVESTYCVDNNRIYVAGRGSGGWLANMWGCYFAGTPSPPLDQPDLDAGRQQRKFAAHWAIRGHLVLSGTLPANQPLPCNGRAAGFWLHDAHDNSNLIATDIEALNLSLKTNGCLGDYANGPKQPWAPAEQIDGLKGGTCQEYTGCPADIANSYPLVFCTTDGNGPWDQPSLIPAFTQFMNQVDATP